MASSSNLKNLSAPKSASMEQYEEPIQTLLTPVDNLEVLYELIIDFESHMKMGSTSIKTLLHRDGTGILTVCWVQRFPFLSKNSGFTLHHPTTRLLLMLWERK